MVRTRRANSYDENDADDSPSQSAFHWDGNVLSEPKEEAMKKQVGLWIDHRETIIVALGDQGEETKRIESDMEKHLSFRSSVCRPVVN